MAMRRKSGPIALLCATLLSFPSQAAPFARSEASSVSDLVLASNSERCAPGDDHFSEIFARYGLRADTQSAMRSLIRSHIGDKDFAGLSATDQLRACIGIKRLIAALSSRHGGSPDSILPSDIVNASLWDYLCPCYPFC